MEKTEVVILVTTLAGRKRGGLDGIDPLSTFIKRRMQPLQKKDPSPRYMYSRLRDPTRVNKKVITMEEIEARLKRIMTERDDVRVSGVVPPYDSEDLPPVVDSSPLICSTIFQLIYPIDVVYVNMLLNCFRGPFSN